MLKDEGLIEEGTYSSLSLLFTSFSHLKIVRKFLESRIDSSQTFYDVISSCEYLSKLQIKDKKCYKPIVAFTQMERVVKLFYEMFKASSVKFIPEGLTVRPPYRVRGRIWTENSDSKPAMKVNFFSYFFIFRRMSVVTI